MDKDDVEHIASGILLNHKEEWNPAIMIKWKDLESIMLSRNKSQKDKYHMISLICEIKKKQTNKHKKTETDLDTENKWWLPE